MLFAVTLDKFLEVLAGFGDVLPKGSGCDFRVARNASVEKFTMCLPGAVQVTRKHQVQTSVAVAIAIQRF